MRNIFLFIRRFFNLILFLVLQGAGVYILTNYNKTHQAVLGAVANEVTGSVSKKYNDVEYYFHLKATNDSLVKENARLHNLQASSFESADTTNVVKIDSLLKDTMGARKFLFMEAKVVNSSVTQENNYITIHRGAKQGIQPDMAVIGPDGIVGKVIMVSDNYSRIMSLLNRKSKVNAMLKNGFYTGDLEWNGADPSYLMLNNISKSAKAQKGDTVLTSNVSQSLSFPPGLMVGTVAEVIADKGSSFLKLRVKAATNFYSLQYVYVTSNLQLQEQKTLEAKTPKD
ncbi:rod shape-determining protein MreC [Panacibacter sp. DH6]|uniref:Cell shape-determining protein MreC n=1 Tax=Panacibacter microcysteis TaxID=2793269 RepID=A0A931E6X3_9BACT|nr:rod shape-determining protein MreC [Panacibacter microcysteis]